jgi:nitroimidazol reductase NimA-like FMN-containing flavoprotein (pyridoxamine 5'-phosphate oxidase superfamily)
MPLSDTEQRFLTAARVARLATADEDGRPHIVPIRCGTPSGHTLSTENPSQP